MEISTRNPFPLTRLPDLALTCSLCDVEVITLPVDGGFDFWVSSSLPFTPGLDSVALSVTGRQAVALHAELRLEQPGSVQEARAMLCRLSKTQRIQAVGA